MCVCGYKGEFVIEISLVGNVLNGLSHFHRICDRSQFAMCLIRGLGGNLTEASREEFAKQVLLSFLQPTSLLHLLDTAVLMYHFVMFS